MGGLYDVFDIVGIYKRLSVIVNYLIIQLVKVGVIVIVQEESLG